MQTYFYEHRMNSHTYIHIGYHTIPHLLWVQQLNLCLQLRTQTEFGTGFGKEKESQEWCCCSYFSFSNRTGPTKWNEIGPAGREHGSGLPLSGRTTYITPWDCHRTSKLNFKDVPRTSKISFVCPKSIPETSKNCQKARPLLTSCMMFAPPTYRKFATCVDWALRTSHFPLAGVLLTAVSSVSAPFWWLRDHCMYVSRVLSWLIDAFIIKFSTATPKIFVEIIWSRYYFFNIHVLKS